MAALKFVDSHNMVAFLSKPSEYEGFEQIATVKAKTVNGEVQLQALVNGKKVIITESTIRRDLQLEDAEGVDYLPNATIFEQLTLMGYEKISQKLTFYKAFFFPQWKFLIHTILQCLSVKTTAWNEFSSTMASKQRPRKPSRKNTEVPQPSGSPDIVADEAVYTERDDSLVRAATTASSLEAEHDSGNINKTQSKATPNEPSFLGTSSGGGPRRQETMRDTYARTSSCLETIKTTQAMEITSLKRRVKKLKRRNRLRTHKLKRLYKVSLSRRVESSDEEGLDEEDASKQGMIADIDAAKDIYLVNVHRDEDMFGVNDLDGDEVVVETKVASKDVKLSVDEVTLAQALVALKSAKPKADKVVIQEPEQGIILTTTAATTVTTASTIQKAKGIVIHEEGQATTPTVSSQQPSQVTIGQG
ncbi:hypothetical protein Tco_1316303 [Tanacetum coccineum]